MKEAREKQFTPQKSGQSAEAASENTSSKGEEDISSGEQSGDKLAFATIRISTCDYIDSKVGFIAG